MEKKSHFKFGIDLSTLKHDDPRIVPPKKVPGRVVHIDADFLAYMVSADSKEKKTLELMKHNANEKIESIRNLAGADKYVLHLTPKDSTKGNRSEIAMLKPYQASRKNIKPKYLNIIRDWMHSEHGAIMHMECEADDGMAMAQYAAIRAGTPELSVIASKDKDLWQVPGLHLDWDTGVISRPFDDFGSIYLDDEGSTKKIRGLGWKYFWAQMLTGDAVDTISGLPKVVNGLYVNKPKLVGPVLAFSILENVKTNAEAFQIVRGLYQDYADLEYPDKENPPFVNYRTGEEIRWQDAFISEAKLLWMRRDYDENDFIAWLRESAV